MLGRSVVVAGRTMGSDVDPDLVVLLDKGHARFFSSTPNAERVKLRKLYNHHSAIPLNLSRSSPVHEDEVNYRVPGIVNTDEE